MTRHASAWMTWTALGVLMMLVSGCASAVSQGAICDGTRQARADHARALAEDGGDLSVVTGARLIGLIDAGCG
ncbi:hypothetical protein [Ketogulonicigenium robustum]|uniref:hypothetical protein n=1 Tax=Ketogulonicigenium robustum TaxID=92947 RepID=UPI0012F4CC5E|nr:hypothetical protein [Ketogulonicigenium robustum]